MLYMYMIYICILICFKCLAWQIAHCAWLNMAYIYHGQENTAICCLFLPTVRANCRLLFPASLVSLYILHLVTYMTVLYVT